MHDLVECLLVKVTTALMLRALVDGLWSSLRSRRMGYNKGLLVARSRRLHLLLLSLWLLLLRQAHYHLVNDLVSLVLATHCILLWLSTLYG